MLSRLRGQSACGSRQPACSRSRTCVFKLCPTNSSSINSRTVKIHAAGSADIVAPVTPPKQSQQDPVPVFYGFSAFNDSVTVLEVSELQLFCFASWLQHRHFGCEKKHLNVSFAHLKQLQVPQNPPDSLQHFAGARLLLLDTTGQPASVPQINLVFCTII